MQEDVKFARGITSSNFCGHGWWVSCPKNIVQGGIGKGRVSGEIKTSSSLSSLSDEVPGRATSIHSFRNPVLVTTNQSTIKFNSVNQTWNETGPMQCLCTGIHSIHLWKCLYTLVLPCHSFLSVLLGELAFSRVWLVEHSTYGPCAVHCIRAFEGCGRGHDLKFFACALTINYSPPPPTLNLLPTPICRNRGPLIQVMDSCTT